MDDIEDIIVDDNEDINNIIVNDNDNIGNNALATLLKGESGNDGITPTIGQNGNWYLGDIDTGKPSRGENGADGKDGINRN